MEGSWIDTASGRQASPSPKQPHYFNGLPNGEHVSRMDVARSAHEQRVRHAKKGEISPEQWDMAKPLIQRLYLEENRTYDFVALALREEYGFLPTKRQFDRKVRDRWAMWKHTKVSQKNTIVEKLDINRFKSMGTVKLGVGRSSPTAKSQRWKQEPGEGKAPTALLAPVFQPGRESMEWWEDSVVGILHSTHGQTQGAGKGSPYVDQILGPRSQSIWEAAYVMDSPRLTGLFAALSVFVPGTEEEQIPDLSLAQAINSESQRNQGFLCSEQIRDLQKRPAPQLMSSIRSNRDSFLKTQRPLDTTDREKLQQMFHAATTMTNPWNEVYPFPVHNPNSAARMRGQSTVPLPIRHIAYKEKLWKLRKTLQKGHMGIILTMETLVSIYIDQENYVRAENLLREIIALQHQFHRNYQQGMVWTHLKYVIIMIARGRLKEAHDRHHQIHLIIIANFTSHHLLLSVSLCLKGRILMNLGDYAASEKVLREALQLRLNIYGPKRIVTLWALSQLAITLRLQGQHCSSEKLLRNVLQLHRDVASEEFSDDTMTLHMASLGRVLGAQHKFAEAEICFYRAWEYSVSHLGVKNRRSLRYGCYLAKVVSCRGDHVKAVELFEAALGPGQAKAVGGKDLPTLTYIAAFTKSLLEIGRFPAAEFHSRNLFMWRSEAYGINRPRTLVAGWDFGCCLARQGFYSKLLEFDRNIVRQLRAVLLQDASQFLNLSSWIEDFQSRIVQVENLSISKTMFEIRGTEFW